MVANALKRWVKQSSPWEERGFVKCNEKLCKLLRRFLQLNNNIKPSLFESLGVSEVQNLHGNLFRISHEFGDSRSSYDFKSVYHIDRKDELIKHSVKFLLREELIGVCIFWCSCHQCDEHSLNALIGNLNTSKTLTGDGLLALFL